MQERPLQNRIDQLDPIPKVLFTAYFVTKYSINQLKYEAKLPDWEIVGILRNALDNVDPENVYYKFRYTPGGDIF